MIIIVGLKGNPSVTRVYNNIKKLKILEKNALLKHLFIKALVPLTSPKSNKDINAELRNCGLQSRS
jgi:hypothetical protein